MSLLLKALQNAAKNREAATTSATPGADASPQPPGASRETGAGVSSSELSLEPVQPAVRTQTPPRAQSSTRTPTQAAPLDEPVERAGGPNPSQARSVLRAGAPAKGPGIFDWVARRPLVAFSTAAGLFAIGYGVYLYLQITNPGVFVAQRTPPPPPVVAQAPVPPQPPAPNTGQPIPPLAPPGQPESLAAPVASMATTPTPPAPGMTTAPTAQQPAATQATSGVTSAAGGTAGAVPAATPPPTAAAINASSVPSSGSTQSVPAPTRPAGAPASPIVATMTPGADAAPAAKPRPVPRPAGAPAAKRSATDGVAPTTAASQIVPVDATLASAYQALEKGQLNDAERLYRQVLASNPNSVDAMLGLASTVAQQNKGDAAIQLYLRVLEKDPRNAYAQAGLLAIGGRADPVAAEARLKQLIARDPSAFLYFTLGNLYSEQGQWAGAQSAYFQAHNLAPDNPDYAFNLAVGLEHVSQPKIALDYYRRALTLAQARGNAQFDPARVQTRIRSLESALAEKP